MNSIRTLLAHLIDYAGLFPPAQLEMENAVRNYSLFLEGDHSWALGRFIVPVSRLKEFEKVAREQVTSSAPGRTWRLSALGGPELAKDLQLISEFNESSLASLGARGPVIDTLEIRVSTVQGIEDAARLVPAGLRVFHEVLVNTDPTELIAAVAKHSGRAKVRTGGIYPEMIPEAVHVTRFIDVCNRFRVPFKATAGLHNPIRSLYPLTYATESPEAVMHGFLNVFLGAAFCTLGVPPGDLEEIVQEEDVRCFRFEEAGVTWGRHRAGIPDLVRARNSFALSFGSCSFLEPMEGLKSLKLL